MLHLVVLCSLTALLAGIQIRGLQQEVERGLGARALGTSQLVADLPAVLRAVVTHDAGQSFNAAVRQYRDRAGADYIVVADRTGIRLAHQIPGLVGKRIESGDVQQVLGGQTQVSTTLGASGLSLRSRVPVRDASGRVIGLVSTGFYLPTVNALMAHTARRLLPWFLLALTMGIAGAILVARRFEREILNLEPEQISTLVRQQRGVLAALPEGVLAVNEHGEVVLANARAQHLLSLTSAELPTPAEHTWPELVAAARAVQASTHNIELRLRGRPVLVNLEPLGGGGYVASVRDRQEVMALAEELTQVRGFVEVLRAQTHEYTNRLHTIGGLLQLGRPDDAMRVIDAEIEADQAFGELLRDLHSPRLAALLMGKRQRAQELEIDFQVLPGSALSGRWERVTDALVTVVGNFTENAFEAQQGRPGCVRVYFGEDPEGMEIEVLDRGPGVRPELAGLLLEPGYSSKGQGRGYGLSLVRDRVAALGGDVQHFRRDEWTVFQMSLPAEAAGLPPESIAQVQR